jgi:hypothetical protein
MNGAGSNDDSWHVHRRDAEWMFEHRHQSGLPGGLDRGLLMDVSKTGDDSRRLQTTQEGNELYTRQRVIKQLGPKVVRHQQVIHERLFPVKQERT